jgi:hypothetical protein
MRDGVAGNAVHQHKAPFFFLVGIHPGRATLFAWGGCLDESGLEIRLPGPLRNRYSVRNRTGPTVQL